MQKQAYHEAAIKYNEVLALAAEELAPTLEDEVVNKWCVAVGKQHRFHAKRHRSALNKLLLKQEAAPVEAIADGLDVPVPVDNLETPFEQEHTETTVVQEPPPRTFDEDAAAQGKASNVFDDGCVDSHQPMEESCVFYPNKKSDDNG